LITWQALDRLSQTILPLRVVLSPFSQDDVTYLIERALATGGAAERLAEFARCLHDETGGNSFFLIEILRALLEGGVLSMDADGMWTLPPPDQSLPTPASVQELIDDRLARLSTVLHEALRRVAVLGENTDFAILSRIDDTPVNQLVPALSELCRRGFLIETETGYRFEHDLLQEAVYRNIDLDQLPILHRRAGEALEAVDPGRTASMAFHFYRGRAFEKALIYALKAGEQAIAVYDYESALAHYQRAYELTEDDPRQRWDVLSHIRTLLRVLGRHEAYQEAIDEMSRLAQEIGDAAIRARTLYFVGNMQQISGIPSEALVTLRKALDLIPAGTQRKLVGQILLQIAHVHWRSGNAEACQSNAEEALAIFRAIEDREDQICVLRFLTSFHLGITGDYAAGLAYGQESRQFSLEVGDAYSAASDLGNIALAYILMGEYEAAQVPLEEALGFMIEIDDHDIRGGLLVFQSINDRCLGHLDQAREAGLRALEICRQTADTNFEIEALGKLGLVAMAKGDLAEARSWFEQAVILAESSEQALDCAENRSHLALVEARLGRCGLALRLSNDALAAMEAAHEVSDRLKTTYWERAQILRMADDPAAAARYLERAYVALMAVAERISDLDLRRSFLENVAENRAILAAHRRGRVPLPLRRLTVGLPRVDAPTGRPLNDDEYVEVSWSITAPEDDEIAAKVDRRCHRILRLLREAAEQSAAPTLEDLAAALDVSVSTVKRDLAALRRAGHEVSTRGSRGR
jgi:tetratricopeptide (TPR) repeat protein